jgi:hypothetical protein
VIDRGNVVVLGLTLGGPDGGPFSEVPAVVYQVFSLADGKVVDIRGFPDREVALSFGS